MLIRPSRPEDVDALYELSRQSSFGLTSLPKDRDLLSERVYHSARSFDKVTSRPGDEYYFFVLEDPENGKLAGACGIAAKVGGFDPFYSYRMESEVHESRTLNIRSELQILHLVAEHSGPTEIVALYMNTEYRGRGLGRLLSLARFLFMAEFPTRFEDEVIVEFRGTSNESGSSPFWDGLGRHFFNIEFPLADYMSAKDKSFIAELLPRYPVYTMLLPENARKTIGQVHERTAGAKHLLEQEGFRFSNMVDIFDAGPLHICPTREIRSVKESMRGQVEAVEDSENANDEMVLRSGLADESETYFVANNRLEGFRACAGRVRRAPGGGVILHRAAAETLGVTVGDIVRYVAARPRSLAMRFASSENSESPANG